MDRAQGGSYNFTAFTTSHEEFSGSEREIIREGPAQADSIGMTHREVLLAGVSAGGECKLVEGFKSRRIHLLWHQG